MEISTDNDSELAIQKKLAGLDISEMTWGLVANIHQDPPACLVRQMQMRKVKLTKAILVRCSENMA